MRVLNRRCRVLGLRVGVLRFRVEDLRAEGRGSRVYFMCMSQMGPSVRQKPMN